ncbi:hypothetical protein [Haloarcula onubensis]|uniref:Small CPxCG-related zinc finger protein n=1 Tax=Haloarcula onubensis TaxID=2950539 RepID=A0ABU2FR40_9EURY|nr:hypothetical protein [Halomicroarcula sp. S3CR25-11]MDS0283228.1 hypothetical protein [Halomicroarcula sp. S3CR25-11]
MVMCQSCGEFVTATEESGDLVPLSDACPDCGETKFKHIESGRTMDTEET